MGIFDTHRRKKPEQQGAKGPVNARDIMRAGLANTSATSRPAAVDVSRPAVRSPAGQSEVTSLLAEYDRLVQKREALRVERDELMARLDRGEITAQEWRKNLMARTQEAAQISEKLRITIARLKFIGYTGLAR